MRIFQAMRTKSMRVMLLALFLCAIPASSFAGVFITVGFAPPVLPVYEQPPCPEPGLMWTPGYWAYDDNAGDYYWVPGTWVPAPYEGALWTPGYWGFEAGLYGWHPGYWGLHVGYYGGVNYGFGYGGIGFAGGMWRGSVFAYNTAVMRVGVGGEWGGRVYEDRFAVDRGFVVRDSHVAYSGGPGGINHRPTPEENAYSHERHMEPTAMQSQHEGAARGNTNNYANHNGGHPQNAVMERPAGGNTGGETNRGGNYNSSRPNPGYAPESHGQNGNPPPERNYNSSHSNTGNAPEPKTYNASHSNTGNEPEHTGGGQQHQPPPRRRCTSAPPPHESHQPPPPSHQPQPASHQPPPKNDNHGHQ